MVMAYVQVIFGDYESAIDRLEEVLAAPAYFSAAWMQIDPLLAPLRDHPRFQKLVTERKSAIF